MSTRAAYIIQDPNDCLIVYKHHDGYPKGAVETIGQTVPMAWELPRFEANEWACAFVAANLKLPDKENRKWHGGEFRFMGHVEGPEFDWKNSPLLPGDISYAYHIYAKPKPAKNFVDHHHPVVTVYQARCRDDVHQFVKLFSYNLGETPSETEIDAWVASKDRAVRKLYADIYKGLESSKK